MVLVLPNVKPGCRSGLLHQSSCEARRPWGFVDGTRGSVTKSEMCNFPTKDLNRQDLKILFALPQTAEKQMTTTFGFTNFTNKQKPVEVEEHRPQKLFSNRPFPSSVFLLFCWDGFVSGSQFGKTEETCM